MGDTTHSRDSPTGTTAARQRPVRPARLLAAAGLWVGLVVVALLNAGFREVVLAPSVGDSVAHVTSTGTLLTALAVVAYLYFRRFADHSVGELVAIGLGWAAMTVLFEFGFGHYVMGTPWHVLVADYDLLAGRVWVLVPLSMAVFPLLFGRSLER
jgi:hypothetical protein